MVHVPYRARQVFADLITGRISFLFGAVNRSAAAIVRQLRAHRVLTEKRFKQLPDVPTSVAGFANMSARRVLDRGPGQDACRYRREDRSGLDGRLKIRIPNEA